MGANEKLKARYRAVELQRKKNAERARRDRANASDAESIRATLHRVGAVDSWERKRFDQAAENIRADAVKRRAGHFRGLQALVGQMRGRGLTFAQIAELVGVDVREIQAQLRRAGARVDMIRQSPRQHVRELLMSYPKALQSTMIRSVMVLKEMRARAAPTIRLGVSAAMR